MKAFAFFHFPFLGQPLKFAITMHKSKLAAPTGFVLLIFTKLPLTLFPHNLLFAQ